MKKRIAILLLICLALAPVNCNALTWEAPKEKLKPSGKTIILKESQKITSQMPEEKEYDLYKINVKKNGYIAVITDNICCSDAIRLHNNKKKVYKEACGGCCEYDEEKKEYEWASGIYGQPSHKIHYFAIKKGTYYISIVNTINEWAETYSIKYKFYSGDTKNKTQKKAIWIKSGQTKNTVYFTSERKNPHSYWYKFKLTKTKRVKYKENLGYYSLFSSKGEYIQTFEDHFITYSRKKLKKGIYYLKVVGYNSWNPLQVKQTMGKILSVTLY